VDEGEVASRTQSGGSRKLRIAALVANLGGAGGFGRGAGG